MVGRRALRRLSSVRGRESLKFVCAAALLPPNSIYFRRMSILDLLHTEVVDIFRRFRDLRFGDSVRKLFEDDGMNASLQDEQRLAWESGH